MSRTHLALLADCAIATTEKGQTILRRRIREGDLFDRKRRGGIGVRRESGERWWWTRLGRGIRLVVLDVPASVWRFTAIAVEPIDAIFFYGTTLKEYCEKDHSLGYELLKRKLWLCSGACRLTVRGCSPSFGNSMPTRTKEKIDTFSSDKKWNGRTH
jgi:hypothetical protein